MAKFAIVIGLGNAAFEGDNLTYEVTRLLRDAASRIEQGFCPFHTGGMILKDINGNTVGHAVHLAGGA